MTDKEKLEKLKKLADAMYYAAQHLTTDASKLHIAMEEYHQFIIHEYFKEKPVSEDEIEKQFKAGDVVVYVSRQPAYSGLYLLGNPNDLSIGYSNANEPYQIALRNCTVASEDERKQFMRELDSNGYKWNEDTLRIEKEEPVSEELEHTAEAHSFLVPSLLYPLLNKEEQKLWKKEIEDAFKAGAKLQAEQMIRDAKSGIGNNDNYIQFEDGTWIDLDPSMQIKSAFNVKEGEKVKVLVIKED